MSAPGNPDELFSPFLPATYSIPEEDDRIKPYLNDNFSAISDVVNDKKIGSYTQAISSQNGEKWFYKTTKVIRNGYQSIAYIPSYPNAGVLTLTRESDPQYPIDDINEEFVITLSYGTASKPPSAVGAGDGDFFSFMNQGDARISWTMSDTTIVITTTIDLTAYSGFIVVHFVRNGI